MRRLLIALLVVGCGGVQNAPRRAPALVNPPVESAPPASFGPFLVGDEGVVVGGYPDGPATLVGLGTRCVGTVEDGRLEGCALGRVRIAIPGDAVATLLAPQSDEAPALAVDASLRGGFPGHSLRFTMESGPGDALCPGSPTLLRFYDDETPLGQVLLDAPVTRQLGHGVVALLVSPEGVFVLVGWGHDRWRLVSVHGETISEGHYARDAECDCCE